MISAPPSTYVLLLRAIRVGRLGRLRLRPGYYETQTLQWRFLGMADATFHTQGAGIVATGKFYE